MSSCDILFQYEPSAEAASFFAIGFGLSAIAHLVQMCRLGAWVMVTTVTGCCLEAAGYITRAVLASQVYCLWDPRLYSAQGILILAAPALVAAVTCEIYERVVKTTGGLRLSILPAGWTTWLFLSSSVFAFSLQTLGACIIYIMKDAVAEPYGRAIVLVGVGLEMVISLLLLALTIVLHHRLNRAPTTKSRQEANPWRMHLGVSYGIVVLMCIRSTYRTLKATRDNDGDLSEFVPYIFDAVPTLAITLLMNWDHPGHIKGTGRSFREALYWC
ncbi:hypothetical protein NKR23_g7284 [Pleurostoma richardsiae]|uniref:RTA1 domain protein n=1 Tax=Pleurostoma richardsiae TaxID=41990 RepID=A0AA38VDK8_9PEZI|nr:hypothetical protein NKR23_g7284 [Pleurostoma richardsiae]